MPNVTCENIIAINPQIKVTSASVIKETSSIITLKLSGFIDCEAHEYYRNHGFELFCTEKSLSCTVIMNHDEAGFEYLERIKSCKTLSDIMNLHYIHTD